MANTLTTNRLTVRPYCLDDAPFIFELLNDDAFKQNIADKGIKTLADAEHYLANGPIKAYENYGYGLSMVERLADKQPMGMCGLVNRPELDKPDLGYALLPAYWRQGFAKEASEAVLQDGWQTLGLKEILAVTLPSNAGSNALLTSLGFKLFKTINLYDSDNNLYSIKNPKRV